MNQFFTFELMKYVLTLTAAACIGYPVTHSSRLLAVGMYWIRRTQRRIETDEARSVQIVSKQAYFEKFAPAPQGHGNRNNYMSGFWTEREAVNRVHRHDTCVETVALIIPLIQNDFRHSFSLMFVCLLFAYCWGVCTNFDCVLLRLRV